MLFLLLLLLIIIFYLNEDKTENFKRYDNEDIQKIENININISTQEPYYNPFDYGYYFPYNNMWYNNYNY